MVYRLQRVAGNQPFVTLLADRIVKGKRVPMYKLDFQFDQARRTLSWEYKLMVMRWKVPVSRGQVNRLAVVLR